jgi:hypothetical protein
VNRAIGTSSNPITDCSSGTLTPRSKASRMTPIAEISLEHMTERRAFHPPSYDPFSNARLHRLSANMQHIVKDKKQTFLANYGVSSTANYLPGSNSFVART